jgi:outer membrane lipoprotein SlyB
MRLRLPLFAAFLFLSACASSPRHEAVRAPPRAAPVPAPVACRDCGRIERVEMVSNVRAAPDGRAVLGGVVGGVVAGRQAPAPAPSAHGAASRVQVLTFRLGLRMDDGRRLVVHQSELASGLRIGSRIRLTAGHVAALR